jgi:hypothetical protein
VVAVDRLEVDLAGMPVRVEAGARELGGDQGQAVFRRGPVELDAGLGCAWRTTRDPVWRIRRLVEKCSQQRPDRAPSAHLPNPSSFPVEDPT